VGTTTDQGYPVITLRSVEIDKGFSGAPVWDDDLAVVVGMVVSFIRGKPVSFIIPSETIWNICDELRPSNECPYRGLEPFTVDHVNEYFGRDTAVRELVEKLRDRRLARISHK
jgi:hypothetical protein